MLLQEGQTFALLGILLVFDVVFNLSCLQVALLICAWGCAVTAVWCKTSKMPLCLNFLPLLCSWFGCRSRQVRTKSENCFYEKSLNSKLYKCKKEAARMKHPGGIKDSSGAACTRTEFMLAAGSQELCIYPCKYVCWNSEK